MAIRAVPAPSAVVAPLLQHQRLERSGAQTTMSAILRRLRGQKKVSPATSTSDSVFMEAKAPEDRFFGASAEDDNGARKQTPSKGLACVDFVEDRMRSRMVAVFVALAMYLAIGADLIRQTSQPQYEHAARISKASVLPSSTKLGPTLSNRPPSVTVISSLGNAFVKRRCPSAGDVCDTDASYEENVTVHVYVSSIAYRSEPRNTIDCSTERRLALAGTLAGEEIRAACTPLLRAASNYTDETGQATLTEMALTSGPPGVYDMTFTPGDNISLLQQTEVTSEVGIINPLNQPGWSMETRLGEPLPTQPRAQVLDYFGTPLAHRRVVVFAHGVPNFYRPWENYTATYNAGDGPLRHHTRGQNHAVLDGVVAETDGDGFASWTNLTVRAISSSYLYLFFYCEGIVQSWNNPGLRAPNPGAVVTPARYTAPIFVVSDVTLIHQLPPAAPPAPGAQPAALEPLIDCGPAPIEVIEGEPFGRNSTMRIRVGKRAVDGSFVPIEGVVVVAVLHTSMGLTLPLLFEHNIAALRRTGWTGRQGDSLVEPKRLTGAISTPSDEDGVATFPDLAFSKRGTSDNRYTTHRVAFCTPAKTGGGYLDGCATSCGVRVKSITEVLTWAVQPNIIRSARAPYDEVMAGEAVVYQLPNRSASPPDTGNADFMQNVPQTPILRATDTDEQGVPGKRFTLFAYHMEWAKQACDAANVSLGMTEAELAHIAPTDMIGKYMCALNHMIQFQRQKLAIELSSASPDGGETGSEGFVAAPIVYTLLDREWLLVQGGVHDLSRGMVRVFAASNDYSQWSPISAPINIAQPPDAGKGGTCVRLAPSPFHQPTELAQSFFTAPLIRPAAFAAVDWEGFEQGTNLNVGGKTLFHRSVSSFLVPPTLETDPSSPTRHAEPTPETLMTKETLMSAEYCLGCSGCRFNSFGESSCGPYDDGYCVAANGTIDMAKLLSREPCLPVDALAIAAGDTSGDGSDDTVACAPGDAGIACRATRYVEALEFQAGVGRFASPTAQRRRVAWPAIRLRALDENGRGVGGLRVRLKFLRELYPDMPSGTVGVISCGLGYVTEGLDGTSGDALNDALKKDGIARQDWAKPCVTDENGFVTMTVDYLETPTAEAIEAQGHALLRPPEYIRVAPEGGIFVTYEARRPYDSNGDGLMDGVHGIECYSDVLGLMVASTVAEVRIGGASSTGGHANMYVVPEGHVVETAGSEAPPPVTVPAHIFTKNDGSTFPLELAAPIAPDTATPGKPFKAYGAKVIPFRFLDSQQKPLPGMQPDLQWLELPGYHLGWSSLLQGCLTTSQAKLQYPNAFADCRDAGLRQTIVDYGLDSAGLSFDGMPMLQRHPFTPFATVIITLTNATGHGSVEVSLRKGDPGLYGFVLRAAGRPSHPIFFAVPSVLASMELAQEPAFELDVSLLSGISSQHALPGGGWRWPVNSMLAKALKVRMLDSSGAPLLGYKALVRAVSDVDGEPLPPNTVTFDLMTDIYATSGSGRSTPADANGVSVFSDLMLVDAVDNTCFKLQAYFEAFPQSSTSPPYMRDVLGELDREHVYTGEIRVTSSVRFCASNRRTVKIIAQPPEVTSLGEPMSIKPVVSIETPLVALDAGSETLYFLPGALDAAGTVELLPRYFPARTPPEVLPQMRKRAGEVILSSFRCAFYGSYPIAGGCTIVTNSTNKVDYEPPDPFRPLLSHGIVLGATSVDVTSPDDAAYGPLNLLVGKLYRSARPSVTPTFWVAYEFSKLAWEQQPGNAYRTMRLGAGTDCVSSTAAAALSSTIALETQPTTLQFMSLPPPSILVGEPFLVVGIVRSANGAPFQGATVALLMAPASGSDVTPLGFLTDVFGRQSLSSGDELPELNRTTSRTISDKEGVVRFVTRFVSAPPNSTCAFFLATGSVKSRVKATIIVRNRVQSSIATNVSYRRTGLNGIGNPNTYEVRVLRQPVVKFPVSLMLPDTVRVTLTLLPRPDEEIKDIRWLRERITIRIFSEEDLQQLARIRQRELEVREQVATYAIDSAVGAINASVASAQSRLNSSVSAYVDQINPVLADGVSGTLVAAAVSVRNNVSDAVLGFVDAQREDAVRVISQFASQQAQSGATPDQLIEYAKLLTSGTSPATSTPSGPSNNAASVRPIQSTQVSIVSYDAFSGVVELDIVGIQIDVRQPGSFKLQVAAAGISGAIGGDLVIEKYDTNSLVAVILEYVFRILTALLVSCMAIGNSDFHNPRIFLPLSVALIIGFAAVTIHRFSDVLQPPYQVGFWWVLCFAGILFFTLLGSVGLLLPQHARIPPVLRVLLTPFAVRRRREMMAYVKALWNEAGSSEVALLQRKLDGARETGSAGLHHVIVLEKRIEKLREEERAYKTQFKMLLRSMCQDDVQAFYYPSRLMAGAALAIFTVSFMAVGFVISTYKLRDFVRQCDVSTLSAIYRNMAVLQEAYQTESGDDLPPYAGMWILDQVERVHKYMVSLADAIVVGAITACVLSLLLFAMSIMIMLLDFRGQILQARRGIWQFNVSKVKLKFATNYIGSLVSNGLFMFVVVAFIVEMLVIIVAWQLTWDVLRWVVVQNRNLIISLASVVVFNLVLKKVLFMVAGGNNQVIKARYLWMGAEMYALLLQVAVGVVAALVRFVLCVGLVLVSLPRVDRSPFPAWIEKYALLDAGSKSYQGAILMHHIHNHPVMRVFVWALQEDARNRRLPQKREELGLVTPRFRRAANRWQKWGLLLRQPKLVAHVANVGVDRKKLKKAVKEKMVMDY